MKSLPLLEPSAPPASSVRPDARYRIEGMDCASCARTLERVVAGVEGVRSARVSFGSASLELWGDPTAESVLAAVGRAGFSGRPAAMRRPAAPAAPFWRRDPRAVSTCLAFLILAVAVVASLVSAPRLVAEPLYLASMAVGGWPVVRSAWAALRGRSLDMNVLMALAAVGAVGVGAYAEGAWVLVLFALGTTLETFALDHTRRSVEALAELAPEEARVVEAGAERLVPVDDVPVGTLIGVRPGERLPLDGVIESGHIEPGRVADQRRVGSRGSRPRRRGLRGLAQPARRARRAYHADRRRFDDRAHRRAGRAGAGEPRTLGAPGRPLRAHLHTARVRRGAARSDAARAVRR